MVGWGNSMELDSVARFGHDRRLLMFEDGAWRPLKPHRPPSRSQRERWNLTEFTFGAEIGFAQTLAEAWPNKRIGIVKQAVGGTGIMAWGPQWSEADADISGAARKGPLYRELLGKALAAREADDVEIRGFLWLRGSKDMRDLRAAMRHAQNLKRLIAALRRDLGIPDLPVLIGTYRQGAIPDNLDGIDRHNFEIRSDRPGAWLVPRSQTDAPETISHSAHVILRDLSTHPGKIHANTEGMLRAGRAYANVYLERFARAQ